MAEIIDYPNGRYRAQARSERPALYWMKHDPAKFLMETAAVDTEGAGAWMKLKGHYWINGCLPKTDAECAKVCGLTKRKFDRYRAWLFSFFDDEGKNAELDAERGKAEQITESRRDAGRKGGLSKGLANARQEPEQSRSHLQPPPQTQSPLEIEEKNNHHLPHHHHHR